MQVLKDELPHALNLDGGRSWSGCCNTNSEELEMAGWGKVLLQGSALHVCSQFPGLGDWFLPSECSCTYNAHLIFGWLADSTDRRASLSHLQWSRSGGQLCCRVWSDMANSFHTDYPTASRQSSAGCYGPGLDSSWQLKHEGLHMPACPLSHQVTYGFILRKMMLSWSEIMYAKVKGVFCRISWELFTDIYIARERSIVWKL